jgi:membrane fusion protein (multidrug efflux system)
MKHLLQSKLAPRLLAVTLLGLTAGCSKPADKADAAPVVKAPPPPPVKVTQGAVVVQKMPQYLLLTGSIAADKQSEVAANVSGQIISTYVEIGQTVKAGQPIAVVDSKASSFSAAAAAAQLKSAETQLALANSECERSESLFKQGALAQADYDRAKAQCQGSVFQAQATKAQADLASKMAGDAIIRAPLSGVVGARYVNVGEYVQPPSKVASIYAVSPVRVSIAVPEQSVGKISQDQVVELTVGAYGDRPFPGKVKYISPALRAQTRDLMVDALVDNADGALKAGMFATVRIVTGEAEEKTVPASAIRAEGTVKRLFLAKDHAAVEMVVQTGVEKDGRVVVLDKDLPTNAQVVVQPPPELHDGSTLQ